MKMYTPARKQGQMIDVAYGYAEGRAYSRTHDRSDQSTVWACGELDWDFEPEDDAGTDHIPCVKKWEICEKPQGV